MKQQSVFRTGKRIISVVLGLSVLVSCTKKSNVQPTPKKTVTLVSQIIQNQSGAPGYGQPFANFTYNGTQLTKSTINGTVTNFMYDSQGQLTGTTIAPGSEEKYITQSEVSSKVTYSGNAISTITFYQAGNVAHRTVGITYADELVKQISDPNGYGITNYTYNSAGNLTQLYFIEYNVGLADGYTNTRNTTSFDTHNNVTGALPMWLYFTCYNLFDPAITVTPGKNNPIASSTAGDAFTYSYSYNSYGYPSAINGYSGDSYKYNYMQVSQ